MYKPDRVKGYVKAILEEHNVSSDKAKITADVLVEADMRGIFSHGINNLDLLVLSSIEEGGTFPDAVPKNVTRNPQYPIRHVDAKGDLGHPPAITAVDMVKKLARSFGYGKVYVFNANHFGAAAIYSEKICAEKDLSGRVTCTTPAVVVPYGGNKNRLGTNLVSWSIPYEGGVVTIDMASTLHAVSGVVKALVEGSSLPFPVYDKDGNETMDGSTFEGFPDFLANGSMIPLGGLGKEKGPKADAGFKGSGLAMLIELDNVIGGGYSGYVGPTVHDEGRWIRQSFEAWRIDTLYNKTAALQHISDTVANIRTYGDDDMLLPGEKESKQRKDSLENGIPYPEATVKRLEDIGAKIGLGKLQ